MQASHGCSKTVKHRQEHQQNARSSEKTAAPDLNVGGEDGGSRQTQVGTIHRRTNNDTQVTQIKRQQQQRQDVKQRNIQ